MQPLAGAVDGEPPVDPDLIIVPLGRPGTDLMLEFLERADPSRETLGGEGTQFVLAMLSQLPGLGVKWSSSRWASWRASAGGKASYKAPRVWVLRLSSTSTTIGASA